MQRRNPFTAVDALVVEFILGLSAGLAMTAVLRVRQANDRSRCSNSLKQLALGFHNYADAFNGKLPQLADQGDGAASGRGLMSLFGVLVPYLEGGVVSYRPDQPPREYYAHSSVVFQYRDKVGQAYSESGGLANRVWKVFVDPADFTADGLRDVAMELRDAATGYYAAGSYTANGLIACGTGTLSKSLPDGAGYTIMIGERPQVCRTAGGESVYNLWGLGFYSPHMPSFATLTPDKPSALRSTGQIVPAMPLPPREHMIPVRTGRKTATPQPPDFATPVQIMRGSRPCDPRLPGSCHLDVMQTAMADGSVHAFDRTVSPWIFWGACTADGGEDLGTGW
jgi:hypothetical protein